ncbi:MAG TPA: hypothetical protein VNV86_20065, partial [Candidatus Acidoferrum sp.]|nr:hypothetical protein [Candidatus Acidoferrum sp.]
RDDRIRRPASSSISGPFCGDRGFESRSFISTMRSSPTVAQMPDKVCAPWLAEYLHEMSVFPNGKHDAQVDSTAQFLD